MLIQTSEVFANKILGQFNPNCVKASKYTFYFGYLSGVNMTMMSVNSMAYYKYHQTAWTIGLTLGNILGRPKRFHQAHNSKNT
jgi:hypothetical protein